MKRSHRAEPSNTPHRKGIVMNRNISRFVVAAGLAIFAALSVPSVASAKTIEWASDPQEMVKLCNASGGIGTYSERFGSGDCAGKDGGYTYCVKPTPERPYNCTTNYPD